MKKNLKYLLILSFNLIILLTNAEEIEFNGRYVIRKENPIRWEFITEDITIIFKVHENVLNKFGANETWDALVNAESNWWVTGSFVHVSSSFDQGVQVPLDEIYDCQATTGVFESQFNLIAIDELNEYGNFKPNFEIGDPVATTIIHTVGITCESGDQYSYMAPIIKEADIGINPWATIKAKTVPADNGEDDYYCLQQILMHEIGHSLGLRHNFEDAGVMNDEIDDEFFITYLSQAERDAIVKLYSGENGPQTPKNLCSDFNTSAISFCKGTHTTSGGGCGGCGGGTCTTTCESTKSRFGISEIAIQNAINAYVKLDHQPDFDSLTYLFIENYSLFESAIDDQLAFHGDLNKGGITAETLNDVPSNRITSASTNEVVYENYPEFNKKLQIAIDEFVPIFNKEFSCDCDASYTYLNTKQINIIKELIVEVKKMPISDGLTIELDKFGNYLDNMGNNNIKTDIINYLNLY